MYKAIVAKIEKVAPIPSADNIQSGFVLGSWVVISKSWKVGDTGVFFPTDCQLSDVYLYQNNLYRHSEKNIDNTQKGFFDDNGRVRCQPFMKVKSEGLFMPIESFAFAKLPLTGVGWEVGISFDKIGDVPICQKYISPQTRKHLENIAKNGKKVKPIETPLFHKHVSTDQFMYNVDKIPEGALLSFHAKVHGTSARMSKTKIVRKPTTWLDKVKDLFGKFPRESWEYLIGTRNVTLYQHQADKEGFHGSEQFRFDAMEVVKPFLEEGMTIYAEISGFANSKPIMGRHDMAKLKDKAYTKKYGKAVTYTYGCKDSEFRLDIYRITYANNQGDALDFTYPQLKAWCEKRGLNSSLEVHPPVLYTGTVYGKKKLKELVENLSERPETLTEDYIDPSHINEGIVLRVDHDTQTPKFYKHKSYAFKVLEGIAKEDSVDIEDAS